MQIHRGWTIIKGRFYFKSAITVYATDGELFDNGESIWTEQIMTFSILAFEGEFFIGRGSGGGHDKAIVKKLKQNDEYITLTNKQSKAESGALSAKAFSDTDESRLKRLEDQVGGELRKNYYDLVTRFNLNPNKELCSPNPLNPRPIKAKERLA